MSIAVLISGGVDSAVVVHKLKEEGHDDIQLFYIRIGMDTDEGDCAAPCREARAHSKPRYDVQPHD